MADVVQRLVRVHYHECYQSSVQARSVAFYEKLPIEEQKLFIRPLTRQIEHDDAAVIHIEKGDAGGMMIHTIDFFRSFIDDPFVFGKIAAVHALSDCHAMGAIARTALALAVVPYSAVEDITEETLTSMLSGASDVLNAEQCALVGGHTCEGSELALGFAVNGFISNPSKIFRKRGGRIGDAIVLTKPLGTGALFAANMRAKGRSLAIHVSEALQSMSQSNVTASRIALNYNYNIHACTDVTGFGLIGHLLEMLVANDNGNDNGNGNENDNGNAAAIGCTLDIHKISFLNGGIEASTNGIFSSLQKDNYRNRRAVSNHVEAAKQCPIRYPLLFDPQTAGGLMFFVNEFSANDFVQDLKSNGVPHATIIGKLTAYNNDIDIHNNKKRSSMSNKGDNNNNHYVDNNVNACLMSGGSQNAAGRQRISIDFH